MSEKNEWKSIESAPKDQLVMVYTPPQTSDWPDTVRIGFDYIDSEIADDYWYNHGEHYEHYCCVAKPENCTGPQERAPYTHWMPLPAVPGSTSTAPGDAQDERQAFEAWAEDNGFVLDCDFFETTGQYYEDNETQLAYDIWRAARASVSAPAAGDALDAARYRWLRDPQTDVALVLDKRTGYVPEDESVPGVGGYHTYEYRAGEELDAAIVAALAAQVPQQGEA